MADGPRAADPVTTSRAYRALLERLYGARRFGVKLELGRMHELLAALGHPQRAIPRVVHIGGTNGKGSTGAFCEALLAAADLRVGTFSSPHLLRLSERFRIDGQEVDTAVLAAAAEEVLDRGAELGATFFELVTAMALVLFARARVDVAVMEVGLGGRFDATNVLRPAVAAVTGVDFDHQEYLGDTLDAIAREKAGIFKPAVPAVVGRAGRDEAVPLLLAGARAAGAEPVVLAEPDDLTGVPLGLRGPHQRANAACAVRAVESVLGAAVVSELVAGGALARATLGGRLERLSRDPDVWVDGAHNPGAAAAVVKALLEVLSSKALIVLGIAAGKDVAGIVRALAPIAARVWCTEATSERALPAAALAAEVRLAAPDLEVTEVADVEAALARARDGAEPVVVVGSLFLVGDARRVVAGEVGDPLAVSDPMPGGPAAR